MPSPEEANAGMALVAKFQAEYEQGGVGLPPGADWVDTAFAYLEHAGVYADEAQARELLQGYGVLVPPPPPPPTFDEAMDLPEWWESFRAFTQTEYSSENPDFLDAVRYQSLDPQAIYDTFVSDEAPRQVNINSSQRAEIQAALADGAAPGYDVFDAATHEVRRLLGKDTWRRFLATQGG